MVLCGPRGEFLFTRLSLFAAFRTTFLFILEEQKQYLGTICMYVGWDLRIHPSTQIPPQAPTTTSRLPYHHAKKHLLLSLSAF